MNDARTPLKQTVFILTAGAIGALLSADAFLLAQDDAGSGRIDSLEALYAAEREANQASAEDAAADAASDDDSTPTIQEWLASQRGEEEQEQPQSTVPASQIDITLDADMLLQSELVFANQVQDQVWTITAKPRHRLLVLPLEIEPDEDQPIELRDPPLDVRRGRFLAWWILKPGEEREAQANAQGRGQPGRAEQQLSVGDSRFYEELFRDGFPSPEVFNQPQVRQSRAPEPVKKAVDAAADGVQGVPQNAPRFTRSITITPEGTVQWEMDRVIPNGDVREDTGEGYPLKIRARLLTDRAPQPPGANNRGTRRSPHRNRNNFQPPVPGNNLAGPGASGDRSAYQRQLEQYRELRERIQNLPEQFETSLPPRLWAVYELIEVADELHIDGPPPFPWHISLDQLRSLRNVASQNPNNSQVNMQQVQQFTDLAHGGHSLSHRMIAVALNRAGWVSKVDKSNPLFPLLQMLVSSEDQIARSIVVKDLVQTIPPNSATLTLLDVAARQMAPTEQLLALRNMVKVQTQDPARVQQMISQANEALADPDGPDSAALLEELIQGSTDRPEMINLLTTGIDFTPLKGERRDRAIAYIIRNAGARQLAANWLNHKLIGSTDPDLVLRTLEMIDAADSPSNFVAPFSSALLYAALGTPQTDPSPIAQMDLSLLAPLPLDTTNHSLYRVLNSGDRQIRDQAWRSLRNFQIVSDQPQQAEPGQANRGPGQPNRDNANASAAPRRQFGETDQYNLILNAAAAQPRTPRSLPAFFAKQPDAKRSTEALVKIVLLGDAATSAQAVRALRGSRKNLGEALQGLDPNQRLQFGTRTYEALAGEVPLVIGLLSDDSKDNPVVKWFGNRVAAGDLPQPREWAEQYPDEKALLHLTGMKDPVLAKGALGALVRAAGGTELDVRAAAETISRQNDRSPEALARIWRPIRQQLYVDRLASAAGPYRMVVRVVSLIDRSKDGGTQDAPPSRRQRQQAQQADTSSIPAFAMAFLPPEARAAMRAQASDASGAQESEQAQEPDPITAFQQAQRNSRELQIEKINLGVVDLVARGQQVRLASDNVKLEVPEQRMAIRVANIADLASFDNDQIQKLPLDRVDKPLDLLPQPDGSWRGQTELFDGRKLELLMEPVELE